VALGMTRLAILDVSPAGHQPMSNADGSIWLVYNGELYNFREERTLLEARGMRFSSRSDTEVVLGMYEAYGDDFLLRMRGMFALAIYDGRRGNGRERLLLARDHLGIKPLLYGRFGGRFVFASELKAMLASGFVPREVDPDGLRQLLTFGSVVQPRTLVPGVAALLPGHRLLVEGGRERAERFWRLSVGRYPELARAPHEVVVETVRDALDESVRLQMVSDVPLGAFLSGGVDSSLLVALMARHSSHVVRTFSVGFGAEGATIDESDDALRTARFIGTEHSKVLVTGIDVRDRIAHIASALDQPSVDGVNAYFVSLAARQTVTVAISGTGGDELFAGYPWFITMTRAAERQSDTPVRSWLGARAASLASRSSFDAAATGRWSPVVERVRSGRGFLRRYARLHQIFGAKGAAQLMSGEMAGRAEIGREPAVDLVPADELPEAAPLERVSALCLRGYTQNQLLRDIDAVSMAHSLEVRVPFLDPVLADIALALPRSAKLGETAALPAPESASYRDAGTKRVLIDIGRGLLPPDMDRQAKRGFGMPFGAWMRGPLREVFEDALSPASARAGGMFSPEATERTKHDFLAGRIDWPQPWLLMMSELWRREVLDGRP